MEQISESQAKSELSSLIDETAESHRPIYIKGKKNRAVLISEDDWRAMEETVYLLSIPGMRESIIKGMNTPLEECYTEIIEIEDDED